MTCCDCIMGQQYSHHHVQLPHHHVTVSVKDGRKPLLDIARTKRGRKCLAIIIPLAVIAGVLSIGFKFISGPGDLGHEISGSGYFSPYTSLVFPISGLYCDSYRVTMYSGSPATTLSWDLSLYMYILNNPPALSSWYNFSIKYAEGQNNTLITLKPGEFYQWSFIFHAGSRYEINSCVLGESDGAKLLIISGKALFREWVVKKQCSLSTCTQYDLPPCNSKIEQSFVRNISKDDEYYFIYLNPTSQLSHIQADMSFAKLEYSFDDNDIYYQCTEILEYSEYFACSSYSLPLTFNGYILVGTMPSDDIDINWEDKIYITWSCDAAYSYAYVLLFCLPFMVVIVIVLICSDIIGPCLSRCRQRQNSDDNATAGTDQPAPTQYSIKVLVVALWFLLVLLISLVIACIMASCLTVVLAVIGFISKAPGIQGISSSKLKLCLLALSTVLFVISLLCNKFRTWIETKLHSIANIIRQQRASRVARNCQARNTSDINSSALRAKVVAHMRNQIMRVILVCGVVPLVIISVVSMSAVFTFLEAFLPVLAQYNFQTDPAIFIPGDTQTFSFNSFFCSEYSISSYGNPHLSATLHIVNSDFLVGNYSVIYINSNDSISKKFIATWNFYLNEKSEASIKACLLEDVPMESSVSLDLYQYDSVGTTNLSTKLTYVTDNCYGDLWQVPIGNISGKDGKFLVTLSTKSEYPIQTHVEIELNRFLYFMPHNISSAQTCSVSFHTSDTCTASAPTSTGSMTGLISVHTDQSPINWHETLSVTQTCQYHMAYWTALWLPVLLINVIIFSVVFGVIHTKQYKQIRKKLDQQEVTEQTDSSSEPLLNNHHEANNNSYGSNTVTVATRDAPDPAGGHSANIQGQSPERSDAELSAVHEDVSLRSEIEQTSDHHATTATSDPLDVVVQIEAPTGGVTSTEARPTSESVPLPPTASIESISDSRDSAENIEHNAADTMLIIDAEVATP